MGSRAGRETWICTAENQLCLKSVPSRAFSSQELMNFLSAHSNANRVSSPICTFSHLTQTMQRRCHKHTLAANIHAAKLLHRKSE